MHQTRWNQYPARALEDPLQGRLLKQVESCCSVARTCGKTGFRGPSHAADCRRNFQVPGRDNGFCAKASGVAWVGLMTMNIPYFLCFLIKDSSQESPHQSMDLPWVLSLERIISFFFFNTRCGILSNTLSQKTVLLKAVNYIYSNVKCPLRFLGHREFGYVFVFLILTWVWFVNFKNDICISAHQLILNFLWYHLCLVLLSSLIIGTFGTSLFWS